MRRNLQNIGIAAVVVSGLSLIAAPVATANSSNNYAQHETISIAFPGNNAPGQGKELTPNDKTLQYLETKFNVTFKFTTETWNNFDTQASLWAASGQLPDLFYSSNMTHAKTFNEWLKSGVIQPLPSNVYSYPYLASVLNRSDVKPWRVNGKMYYWPTSLAAGDGLNPAQTGIFVRKDWLQKLHLTNEPKTWNDFVNMLKDFVKSNPDHVQSLVGMTAAAQANSGSLNDLLISQFPLSDFWEKDNGRWVPGWTDPKQMTVVNNLHELYSQGLLDKDFANANNPYVSKFVNGQAGAIVYLTDVPGTDLETAWNQAHPKEPFTQYVEPLIMPSGPDGKRYMPRLQDWTGGYFVSSSVDSTKMQRILAICNYLASPEGRILGHYGLQGIDWKMVNGKVQLLHNADWYPPKTYPSIYAWWDLGGFYYADPGYNDFPTTAPVQSGQGTDPLVWTMMRNYFYWCYKQEVGASINWTVNAYATLLPPVNVNLGDWESQAIVSNSPGTVWRKDVSEWLNGGGATQIVEVTNKFKNQNN